jgi:glycosyltransferase involved in cell wall biosynthesis
MTHTISQRTVDAAPAKATMQVAMFTPTARGGHAQYAQALLSAMAQQHGPSVGLVSSQDLDPEFFSEHYPVAAVLPILKHRREYPHVLAWAVSRLTHYAQRDEAFFAWTIAHKVQAVHLQEFTPWKTPALIERWHRQGVKVILTVHNIWPHKYPWPGSKGFVDAQSRKTFRAADALIVHTQGLKHDLEQFIGPGGPSIHVAPHGTWEVAAQKEATLADVELRLKRRHLLFFGTIRANKGLHLLLDAMPQLSEYTLTIGGAPLDEEYHRREIVPRVKALQESGLDVRLSDRFLSKAEIAQCFDQAGTLMLPYSDFSSQSGVLYYAIAYACPAVVSNKGALGDTVQSFGLGTVMNSIDPSSIARAVRQLEGADPLAMTEGFKKAAKEFSWQTAAERTIKVYQEVLGE